MIDLAVVELLVEVPPMPAGSRGVIVVVHDGGDAFEVEFCDEAGRTVAVITVRSNQIRPIARDTP